MMNFSIPFQNPIPVSQPEANIVKNFQHLIILYIVYSAIVPRLWSHISIYFFLPNVVCNLLLFSHFQLIQTLSSARIHVCKVGTCKSKRILDRYQVLLALGMGSNIFATVFFLIFLVVVYHRTNFQFYVHITSE